MRSAAEPLTLRLAALALAIVLSALFGGACPAHAAASCSATVTSGSFPTIDTLTGGAFSTTATLSFNCTGLVPGVPVTLCPNLDAGSGGTDGAGGRRLAGPSGAYMDFQVWQDVNHTQPWGSSALLAFGAVPTITATPNLGGVASATRTLYATVTAAAGAIPQNYKSSFVNEQFFWGLNLLSCAGITIGTFIPPATFSFDGDVSPNCGVTVTNLAFGTVGLLDHVINQQNSLSVKCTASTPWSLSLDNGTYGAAPAARKMANGTARVTYGIYKDNARTQIWGTTAQGAAAVQSGTGTGSAQPFTGYGRVPIQTTPAVGAYTDTVVATLTY